MGSTAAGVTTATTTLLAAPAVTGLLGAAVIVKGIGLGLLLRDAGKKKRDVSGGPTSLGLDSSFAIISQLEPAQCIRRLICDVASGALPADENGKNFGSVEKCELRYSCPLSAGQLRQIFNE